MGVWEWIGNAIAKLTSRKIQEIDELNYQDASGFVAVVDSEEKKEVAQNLINKHLFVSLIHVIGAVIVAVFSVYAVMNILLVVVNGI